MSATALEVLPLDEAKRQLSLEGTTDRDTVVTDAIERAVSHVGRLNGVPLVQAEKQFPLIACSVSQSAMIDMPLGWPQPDRSVSVQWRTPGSTGLAMATAGQERTFEYDPEDDAYYVAPAAFGFSVWPATELAWRGVVGLAGRPEPRIVGACVIAMRALYADLPIPDTVAELVQ